MSARRHSYSLFVRWVRSLSLSLSLSPSPPLSLRVSAVVVLRSSSPNSARSRHYSRIAERGAKAAATATDRMMMMIKIEEGCLPLCIALQHGMGARMCCVHDRSTVTPRHVVGPLPSFVCEKFTAMPSFVRGLNLQGFSSGQRRTVVDSRL